MQLINGIECAKRECSLEQMKFDTSWDWLMSVVEKCEDMGYYFEISGNAVQVTRPSEFGSEVIYLNHAETKIQAAYEAVIWFIENFYP